MPQTTLGVPKPVNKNELHVELLQINGETCYPINQLQKTLIVRAGCPHCGAPPHGGAPYTYAVILRSAAVVCVRNRMKITISAHTAIINVTMKAMSRSQWAAAGLVPPAKRSRCSATKGGCANGKSVGESQSSITHPARSRAAPTHQARGLHLISRWRVWRRRKGLYFISSRRSGVFLRFFWVT